tara:strand:- start:3173 stop:3499 length:327 start_codon:yes stop_codon:yes gene_type:complete
MKQYNHQAIRNLYPNAKIVKYSQETKSFKVYDENEDLIKIDYAKVETQDNKIISEFQATQYQRDRASQYPSIQDVVVALAEKQEGNDTMWKEITAKRAKVKADNPKPT